jgi:uncharacterized protein YjiS (DUF1127 family)
MTVVSRTLEAGLLDATRLSAYQLRWIAELRTTLALWHLRSSERSRLALWLSVLGVDFVRYTGISRSQARAEASKPFWRA